MFHTEITVIRYFSKINASDPNRIWSMTDTPFEDCDYAEGKKFCTNFLLLEKAISVVCLCEQS